MLVIMNSDDGSAVGSYRQRRARMTLFTLTRTTGFTCPEVKDTSRHFPSEIRIATNGDEARKNGTEEVTPADHGDDCRSL